MSRNRAVALSLWLTACHKDGPDKPAEHTSETGKASGTLSGALTYRSTVDGVTRCDQEVDLHGEPSDRPCPDCTWVYDVVGTVVRDGSAPECRASPVVTFVPGFGYDHLAIAAAPTFLVDWVDPPVELSDVLLSGYDHDGGDYLLTDVWEPLSWTADPNGAWSLDDGLSWSRAGGWDEVEYLLDGFAPCEDLATSTTTTPAVGSMVLEELPCDHTALDLWVFDGRRGEELVASVDTIAADTAFTPFLWVNGPTECTLVQGIDDVPCTFPSDNLGRSCPAATLVLPETGTYVIRVGTDLGCTGTVGAYALTTSGTGPLTLDDDDRDAVTTVTHHWTEAIELTAVLP